MTAQITASESHKHFGLARLVLWQDVRLLRSRIHVASSIPDAGNGNVLVI